ncbi:hypothetical protein GTQ40_07530 [Flavobacteriaceae bacterium R38]|nr:hypothetical protein [Flavobacteriaceae bacterium R38]
MAFKRILLFCFCIIGVLQLSAQQTQADSYTRYELLDPASQSFRIIYDVSATKAGIQFYWNTLRRGSEHTVDEVYDLYSGDKLSWEIVDGKTAKNNGLTSAREDTDYLQVKLARPVPQGGESRIRIDKTYKDTNSYYKEGEVIVFNRSLGIKRNAIVLPANYEVIGCNHPSQVVMEDSGKIKISFLNDGVGAVPLIIKARPLKNTNTVKTDGKHPWPDYKPSPQGRDKSKARLNYQLNERAFQDREIVYFMQQPETHSFRLYHDYTEKRPGIDKYVNIVRPGSKASNPSAKILDTGENLKVETLRGSAITAKGIEIDNPTNETEAVVIWFDPVKKGASTRLRIEETYTDPNRYLLYNGELVWDRSFGRNRNRVIMPKGWYLTVNSIPAIINITDSGEIQLDYVNPRPDVVDVLIKGRRR